MLVPMKKFPCLDFLMKSNLMVIYFHLTVFLNLRLFTSSVFCRFSKSYKRWPQLANCSREPSPGSSSKGFWLSACSPRLFGPSLSLMVWRFFPASQQSNNFSEVPIVDLENHDPPRITLIAFSEHKHPEDRRQSNTTKLDKLTYIVDPPRVPVH